MDIASALDRIHSSNEIFVKFVSPNDAGETGAHQGGIYLPKSTASLFFSELGKKGENRDAFFEINWQDFFRSLETCLLKVKM